MPTLGKKENGTQKPEGGSDFLRFPMGTRIAATPSGKLSISFAGDVSIGESLPELGELSSGRNLSVDAGVVLNSEKIIVKNEFDANPGSKITTNHLEAQKVTCRRAELRARKIATNNVVVENCILSAEEISTRDDVYLDRGELEIGILKGKTLRISKGTVANIMIADVEKVDGSITKGGYRSQDELLAKLYTYCRQVLNEKSLQDARKVASLDLSQSVERVASAPSLFQSATSAAHRSEKEAALLAEKFDTDFPRELFLEPDPNTIEQLRGQVKNLLNFYSGKEIPREIQEIVAYVELKKIDDLRRNLNACYQKLAQRVKIQDEVTEMFFAIQKVLKEEARMKREKQAK
jgi:hypothetical protein